MCPSASNHWKMRNVPGLLTRRLQCRSLPENIRRASKCASDAACRTSCGGTHGYMSLCGEVAAAQPQVMSTMWLMTPEPHVGLTVLASMAVTDLRSPAGMGGRGGLHVVGRAGECAWR